jgi:transposase
VQRNRVIVISVVVEGRSMAEVAKKYGVTYRLVVNPATSELFRELTLEPTQNDQPQKPQNALPTESEL